MTSDIKSTTIRLEKEDWLNAKAMAARDEVPMTAILVDALRQYLILRELERSARDISEGHLTILKSTTRWRVAFGSAPDSPIIKAIAPYGATLAEAGSWALRTGVNYDDCDEHQEMVLMTQFLKTGLMPEPSP